VQRLPLADTDSDYSLLVAKICTRYKGIIRIQNQKPVCGLEKLYDEQQKVQDVLLCKWECGSAVKQYQEMCVRYYEWFGWERRRESKRK
jgi:hypothetical protein